MQCARRPSTRVRSSGENTNAEAGLGFFIAEGPHLQLGANDGLPLSDLGFDPAALVVTCRLLPC